ATAAAHDRATPGCVGKTVSDQAADVLQSAKHHSGVSQFSGAGDAADGNSISNHGSDLPNQQQRATVRRVSLIYFSPLGRQSVKSNVWLGAQTSLSAA